jgi:cytochrome P450
VYGEDVEVFRPERWLPEESEKRIEGKVGVYSGIMTFLHGQRACIGYKFGCASLLLSLRPSNRR